MIYNTQGGDPTWPILQQYIAAIIEAGGSPEVQLAHYGYERTFIGEATLHSNSEAVAFALAHNADPTAQSFESYPLAFVRTGAIAQLLVQSAALPSILKKPSRQWEALTHSLQSDVEPQVLLVLQASGLNLKRRGENQSTLLHNLCWKAQIYKKPVAAWLVTKMETLLQAGIDPQAVDHDNCTASDVLDYELQYTPRNESLLLAKNLLDAWNKNHH
jgi:hypothetical protein